MTTAPVPVQLAARRGNVCVLDKPETKGVTGGIAASRWQQLLAGYWQLAAS
jgi:hypothetical protein